MLEFGCFGLIESGESWEIYIRSDAKTLARNFCRGRMPCMPMNLIQNSFIPFMTHTFYQFYATHGYQYDEGADFAQCSMRLALP